MQVDKTKKSRALAAMKKLRLKKKFVLAVLKDALKLHSWDLLEADNFNLLADLAFQRQADQGKNTSSDSWEGEELYEDDTVDAQLDHHQDACFEHKPMCSMETSEKRFLEAGTSNFCKRPKQEGIDIGTKTNIVADVSCGPNSKPLRHAKHDFSEKLEVDFLNDAAPPSRHLSSGNVNISRTSCSTIQYDPQLQNRSDFHVKSETALGLDHNFGGIVNSTNSHKPDVRLASSGRKLTEGDKSQEEALAGWNFLRDKQTHFSQHERGNPESLSRSLKNISKSEFCSASLDNWVAKENGSTAVEENPAALNLIMENYPSSSDTFESDTAALSNTDKLAVSKECSITTENKVRSSEAKEIFYDRESKQIELKIESKGESSCQVFYGQKVSCATQCKNLSLPSVDPLTDEVKGGLVADDTYEQDDLSIREMVCSNGVGVRQDRLQVLKKKSLLFDPDVESTSRHNSLDISRGEENIQIPLAQDVVGKLFPRFYYTSKCVIYQNAPVTFSLAKVSEDECCSSCFGDCLDSPIACPCAKETGGEYAYNADGCLHDWFLRKAIKEKTRWDVYPRDYYCPSMSSCPIERLESVRKIESCKGHLLRKFIKECWSKCGCDKRCGNRVVQRGINRRLEVFWAPHGKGWGVRTLENLPAGAFVCEYVGEILTLEELESRKRSRSGYLKQSFPLLLDADLCSDHVLKNEEPLCLDSTYYGNISRFINHRCYDANVLDVPILIESTDRHYYHVAYFTNRPVEVHEELTRDYEIDFDDKHSPKAFQCRCGSRFCRGRDL